MRETALRKEAIEQAKRAGDCAFFHSALNPTNEDRVLLFVLESLGKLPRGFDYSVLVPLVHHPNDTIRLAVAKNLGKLEEPQLLDFLSELVFNEQDTFVRRELVSAIGRLRTHKAIPILCRLLDDEDPKVMLQVIRALLAGRGTVGQAAMSLERYFFLTEKDARYANYAYQLLINGSLFSDFRPQLLNTEEFVTLATFWESQK